MRRIVECVPNFSEGRDRERIGAITAAIESVEGAVLLDVDPGADTNRTVVTFVGEPEAVVEAAFRAIAEAARLIDMRVHSGAHPRMGATDVCPFVPVRGVTMEDCVELARQLGRRVGEELGIPVYLYEHAATRPERRNLADVRAGEYEGLPARVGKAEWAPDFGPHIFHAQAGATAVGARQFLIAYNVNLNTRSRKLAHDIALDIRESGRRRRDSSGQPIRGRDGEYVTVPGRLAECKAVGWYIPEYGAAQISVNLTDFRVTGLHHVFDAVEEEAQRRGLRVTGSEIVGLVPLEALRAAGLHYLARQGVSIAVPERELIHVAERSLGLGDIAPFDPAAKIIESRLRRQAALVDRTVGDFLDELSTESPAPGGGSAASLMGALSAALTAMVTNLTIGKRGYEDAREPLNAVGLEAQTLKDQFREDVDRDADAFNALFAALKAKAASPEEAAAKARAVRETTQAATEVPLGILERAVVAVRLAGEVVARGNRNSLSDAGVAALAARACAESAFYNVLINLPGVDDPEWVASTRARAAAALQTVRSQAEVLTDRVRTELESRAGTPEATTRR
jgi:glutamate formiminotransferase/formiminotetrahydrofolate cyclodeaminase